MPATVRIGIRHCLAVFGLLATLAQTATTVASGTTVLPAHDSLMAARRFEVHIERFLSTLPLEREGQEVRINRCQSPQGDMRDDVYALWIGARLTAPGNDADTVLAEVRAGWTDNGWELTRDRILDNGGRNIAGVEPGTGYYYSLDSGFDIGPRRYVVGYFTTPCFADPSGAASFGALRAD